MTREEFRENIAKKQNLIHILEDQCTAKTQLIDILEDEMRASQNPKERLEIRILINELKIELFGLDAEIETKTWVLDQTRNRAEAEEKREIEMIMEAEELLAGLVLKAEKIVGKPDLMPEIRKKLIQLIHQYRAGDFKGGVFADKYEMSGYYQALKLQLNLINDDHKL